MFPQMKKVRWMCRMCSHLQGPFECRPMEKPLPPRKCPECQGSVFEINTEGTEYRNYQKITLQESPGSVPPGRVPRHKDVILLADLVDKAKPGDEIEVTAIYCNSYDASLNTRNGFPVFSTVLMANFISQVHEIKNANCTEEELKKIRKLSKDPSLMKKLLAAIAPSIYGQDHAKIALAMSLFGGKEKVQPSHRIRGDINLLFLGDPGTAKSQLLKFAEKTAPRAIYTTGRGATAVGLTASVHKDPVTREWTLEGGALVLADRGVCLIDEFDKMNPADRVSIHEAMEQQSISISKAGIVTTLQARCAVIAAANPIGGRYDPSRSLYDNVELTAPILGRFDILCVFQDTVDPIIDGKLADFVVSSHMKSNSNLDGNGHGQVPSTEADDNDGFTQDLLRKYIMYSKQSCDPHLNPEQAVSKIVGFYRQLRSHSEQISVRHLESIIRMSEAHARMHLRDYVRDDDIDAAIATALESFIQSQKFGIQRSLRKEFGQYIIEQSDHNELLLYIILGLVNDTRSMDRLRRHLQLEDIHRVVIPIEHLEIQAREMGIYGDLHSFYDSDTFKNHNFTIEHEGRNKVIVHNS